MSEQDYAELMGCNPHLETVTVWNKHEIYSRQGRFIIKTVYHNGKIESVKKIGEMK